MRLPVASFIACLGMLSLLLNMARCQDFSVEQIFSNQGKLSQDLDFMFQKVKKDSSIIFVMGDTGSGKSTLINYLIGNPLKVVLSDDQSTLMIDTVGKTSIEIGHQARSKTKFPRLAEDKNGNIFVDTAGFEDSQGTKVTILNKLILKHILGKVQKKKVVLVVEAASLRVTRGKHLKTSLLEIKHFFEQTVQNIAIVVSKSNCISNYREIISNILKEDDSFSSEEHRKFYRKITKRFKVLQFCQPSKEDYDQSKQNGFWDIQERQDRKNMLSALAELKQVKYSKLGVTFGEDEARMIESLIHQIKEEGRKKIKHFFSTIVSFSKKLSLEELKQFRKSIVCTTAKKGPYFDQNQSNLNWFNTCFYTMIDQLVRFSPAVEIEQLQDILIGIEKKVDLFSVLLEDIYVTSQGVNNQKVCLSFNEQIVETSAQLKDKLQELIEVKEKQEELRKKEEQMRRKLEQQYRRYELQKSIRRQQNQLRKADTINAMVMGGALGLAVSLLAMLL